MTTQKFIMPFSRAALSLLLLSLVACEAKQCPYCQKPYYEYDISKPCCKYGEVAYKCKWAEDKLKRLKQEIERTRVYARLNNYAVVSRDDLLTMDNKVTVAEERQEDLRRECDRFLSSHIPILRRLDSSITSVEIQKSQVEKLSEDRPTEL